MSTTQTQEVTSSLNIGVIKLTGEDAPSTGWQADLARDGFAVVKGAVPKERAAQYAERMHEWLEGFGLGYDRTDRSTWTSEHLPEINNKGMCLDYAVAHEDFVWDVRAEPGVVGTFEEVLGTKDLIVSFDAVNFDPKKAGFRCLQGLVNILPNGPNDGGLIVCKGGHQYSEQFHKEMAWEEPIPAWNPEWYGFTDRGMEWLANKGLEWVKLDETDQNRFCVYTCYMPVADASQEALKRKKTAFEGWFGTTHWPNCQVMGRNQAKRNGELDPHNRTKPAKAPQLSERAYKLTGIPYIATEA
ncbi:hypothetical protein BDZ85DRAFT_279023 [Elsinoe ampelina]|uniref:Uncharacterized protein n=1 Tax=Elsinoe ampelina TaxID=302913 RepID=A0A6A6GN61_9PEZI|nr:hypothetical protein BDZ85DRAFT_279023 [Elsinoe ampelina]